MLKTIVVDDERLARSRVKKLSSLIPELQIMGEAANGVEALKLISQKKPDLVILDIEMPGLSGIELATLIDQSIKVIFTTAYENYAVKAFEVNAIDYLLKPIAVDRFKKAIKKILYNEPSEQKTIFNDRPQLAQKHQQQQITFKKGAGYEVIHIKKISAIVSQNQYADVYYDDKKIMVHDSLDDIERKLPSELGFFRIHRSAIVNIMFIKKLYRLGDRKYKAILDDFFNLDLPISRAKLPLLKERLSIQ